MGSSATGSTFDWDWKLSLLLWGPDYSWGVPIASVWSLKMGKPCSMLNGAGKKKEKLFVDPPRSWIAIVKAHNKRGKVIQIAAQLCSPGICFSILHLPMCTKGHLCTCALNIFFFFTGFLGRTHSAFQRHANGWRQHIMPASKFTSWWLAH